MLSTRLYGPSGAPGAAGSVALNTNGAVAVAVVPLTQIVTTTTETVVLNPALNSSTQALVLSIPASSGLEKIPFKVQASGSIKGGTTTNATVKLYFGTSTTVGNNTMLGTTGAVAANSATVPFFIEANLIYDSVGGRLTGTIKGIINATVLAETAVSALPTSIGTQASNAPVANFVLSITFSVANAANAILVEDFAVHA